MADALKSESGLAPVGVFRLLLAGVVIGALAVVFNISFTAIIYNGDLGHLLSRGIGLTLLGATIMGAIGAFVFSYRGTICQPQDVTAILLSLAAARIAQNHTDFGPEVLFATVAALMALTTLTSGLVAYLFGHFKLCFVARFIPYPVLGGFLGGFGFPADDWRHRHGLGNERNHLGCRDHLQS